MAEAAVIFDVDGVLLELTSAEEELYFQAFEPHLEASLPSRDWNSYHIRNEENIVEEILEVNRLPSDLKQPIIKQYFNLMNRSLKLQELESIPVSGAAHILSQLSQQLLLGVATANFLETARMRLEHVKLWEPVAGHAFGANGGGHKSEILARTIASMNLPPNRIVYIGDNLNDQHAARVNGTHFIGFSTSPERREILANAGTIHVSSTHSENATLINQLLKLPLTKGTG